MWWVTCKCVKCEIVKDFREDYILKKSPCKNCETVFSIRQLNKAEYCAWSGAKNRCTNPNNISYADYGGRNIKMHDRWLYSFKNFLEDMGKKPKARGTYKYSLDRIDVNGNYEPSNCRWATYKTQANNKRERKTDYNELDRIITVAFWQTMAGFIPLINRYTQ